MRTDINWFIIDFGIWHKVPNMKKLLEDLCKKNQALKQEQTKEATPEVNSKQQRWEEKSLLFIETTKVKPLTSSKVGPFFRNNFEFEILWNNRHFMRADADILQILSYVHAY